MSGRIQLFGAVGTNDFHFVRKGLSCLADFSVTVLQLPPVDSHQFPGAGRLIKAGKQHAHHEYALVRSYMCAFLRPLTPLKSESGQ